MRHVLLMTVYKDVKQINRFISKTPNDWGVFIHIDKKSDIKMSDISSRAQICKKYKIYWGSCEHIKAFLFLMSIASRNNYDYYHLVTGQDYYASNPSDFDERIGNGEYNFLDIFPLPRKGWRNGDFSVYHIKTLSSFGDVRHGIIHNIDKILYYLQGQTKKVTIAPKKWNLYGGSVYCSLTREFVNWLLKEDVTLDLLHDIQNTTCGEEIFFQTLVMLSPYKEKVCPTNLRYIDWSVWSPPKVLDQSDLEKVTTSKCLFCRKIDSLTSISLLDKIDITLNL